MQNETAQTLTSSQVTQQVLAFQFYFAGYFLLHPHKSKVQVYSSNGVYSFFLRLRNGGFGIQEDRRIEKLMVVFSPSLH